jgi:uncharacterized membrane protein YeaQ/YmgE (transglycosylase-associated protein family)
MLALLPVLLILVVVLVLVGWALWLIVSAAVVGAVIGALARLVIPGRQMIGVLNTVVIGWIGSLVGSLLGRHALHVGRLGTLLCEVGVAAVLVLLASSRLGNAAARRNARLRY